MSIWYRLQVSKNQHGLYALAYQMLGNQLEAEDVVQDTFIKLWQRKEDGGKYEKAWLYKVTRNHCLDILRRRKHAYEYQMAQAVGSDVAPSASDAVLNEELGSMSVQYALSSNWRDTEIQLKHGGWRVRCADASHIGWQEATSRPTWRAQR